MSDWTEATPQFIEALEAEFVRRRIVGWQVYPFASVSSTMDIAQEYASSGDERAAYYALEQTSGRGREGRSWTSAAGKGVYATFCFAKPAMGNVSGLSLAAGIAVLRALSEFEVAAKLKWPNDVLAEDEMGHGKKIAGILVDVASSGAEQRVFIGVGINLDKQESADSTSCREISGREPSYAAVGAALCEKLDGVITVFREGGFAPFFDEWNSCDYARGKTVCVFSGPAAEKNPQRREGISRGVAEDGALLFEQGGSTEKIYSGRIKILD